MRFRKAWIVASKDLKIFRKRKGILYSVILLPLILAIGFPLLVLFIESKGAVIDSAGWINILNTFSFFFIILAAVLPTTIATYAIVGEKVEKSLEPLLATPTTDSELLLGKSIAAFFPPHYCNLYRGHHIYDLDGHRYLQSPYLSVFSQLEYRSNFVAGGSAGSNTLHRNKRHHIFASQRCTVRSNVSVTDNSPVWCNLCR